MRFHPFNDSQKKKGKDFLCRVGLIGGFQGYSGLLELIAHIIDIMEVLAQFLDPPSRLDHLNVHMVPFIYMQLIELPE
jgi:hypothetical protein